LMMIEKHKNIYLDWDRDTCKSSICKEYIIKCIEDPNNTKNIILIYNKGMSYWLLKEDLIKRLSHRNITHKNTSKKLLINGSVLDFIRMDEDLTMTYLSTYSDSIFIFDEMTSNYTMALSQLLLPYLTMDRNKNSQFIFSKSTGSGNPVSIITSTFEHCNHIMYHSKQIDIKTEFRKLKIKKLMGNIR